jgi:hypothetical protein
MVGGIYGVSAVGAKIDGIYITKIKIDWADCVRM